MGCVALAAAVAATSAVAAGGPARAKTIATHAAALAPTAGPPTVSAMKASDVTATSATISATIRPNSAPTTY
jgi:hypothetical protein